MSIYDMMITHVAVALALTSQSYMMHDIFPYSQNGFYVFCQKSCLWTTGEKKTALQEKKAKKKVKVKLTGRASAR